MGKTGAVTEVIARELRGHLARRRLTNAQLARAAGLAPSTVNRALRGATSITLDQYVPIVAALNGGDQRKIVAALVAAISANGHDHHDPDRSDGLRDDAGGDR